MTTKTVIIKVTPFVDAFSINGTMAYRERVIALSHAEALAKVIEDFMDVRWLSPKK